MSDPAATLAQVAASFVRLAGRALLLVLALGVVAEIAARMLGATPQILYRTGLVSTTMPDTWTGWAMRPDVRYNEYTVTNAYGLHEDREVTLAKPAGMKRIAVVGSSVAWGLNMDLQDTIPRSTEVAMRKAGCAVEVLNFAGFGFNILNTSAFVQTKLHQFQPDAIVVVMDIQMVVPRFPVLVAGADERRAIKTLGTFEGWFKRATEYSVVLTWLDDPAALRTVLKQKLPLPVDPPDAARTKATAGVKPAADYGERALGRFLARLQSGTAALLEPLKNHEIAGPRAVVAPAAPPRVAPATASVASHEDRRARELGGVVASMAAFSRQIGIPMYFVTPYGPYFHARPEEIKLFSLNMLQDAARIYGGIEPALAREMELSSEIVARAATGAGARVIDMLPASRDATMALGDFSSDGIHLNAQGYHRVGGLVAERLRRDGLCDAGG